MRMIFWVLMSLMLIAAVSTSNHHNDDDEKDWIEAHHVCEGLRKNLGPKINLFFVGTLLNGNLLLITKDFWTFEVPISNNTNVDSIDTINLNARLALKMEKKYPSLWNDPQFQSILNIIKLVFLIRDDRSQYLSFSVDHTTHRGISYDLNNQKISTGFNFNRFYQNDLVIFPGPFNWFFVMFRERGTVHLTRWIADNNKDLTLADSIVPISENHALCYVSEKKDIVRLVPINTSCEEAGQGFSSIDWPLQLGFFNQDRFHLFGMFSVHTFHQNVWYDQDLLIVTEMEYKDLFQCSNIDLDAEGNHTMFRGAVGWSSSDSNRRSDLSLLNLVTLSLIILIYFLTSIACICAVCQEKRTHKLRNKLAKRPADSHYVAPPTNQFGTNEPPASTQAPNNIN